MYFYCLILKLKRGDFLNNNKLEDISLLVEVCYSYYNFNKTQSEIASGLGISRAKVSNLLSEAKKEGIIEINIIDPLKRKEKLEKKLRKKYDLRDVIVMPVPNIASLDIKKELGKIASDTIKKMLRDGDIIGISGGSTIYEMVKSIDQLTLSNITVVPMFGAFLSVYDIDNDLYTNNIVRQLAEKTNNADVANISAPGKVESKEIREMLTSHKTIKKGLNIAKKCSVSIVGIGTAKPNASVFSTEVLTKSDLRELKNEKAVGDICLQFFDKQGQPINQFNEKVIGISLKDIKEMPLVIGVAGGGEGKSKAIKAALKGGYLHILITDQLTAEKILEEN